LSDVKLNEVMSQITSLMEDDLLYQEPELTLLALSEKLGIPSYQVSKVINEGLKTTFYDLVNGYRVKDAKSQLLDPKNRNYTILSVGFEAGFNSKTTFNTVFKKFTGLTPTEYREKNRAEAVLD
jgi:AraC-like DNA-binding protein